MIKGGKRETVPEKNNSHIFLTKLMCMHLTRCIKMKCKGEGVEQKAGNRIEVALGRLCKGGNLGQQREIMFSGEKSEGKLWEPVKK